MQDAERGAWGEGQLSQGWGSGVHRRGVFTAGGDSKSPHLMFRGPMQITATADCAQALPPPPPGCLLGKGFSLISGEL